MDDLSSMSTSNDVLRRQIDHLEERRMANLRNGKLDAARTGKKVVEELRKMLTD
jgi:hypothetical protein